MELSRYEKYQKKVCDKLINNTFWIDNTYDDSRLIYSLCVHSNINGKYISGRSDFQCKLIVNNNHDFIHISVTHTEFTYKNMNTKYKHTYSVACPLKLARVVSCCDFIRLFKIHWYYDNSMKYLCPSIYNQIFDASSFDINKLANSVVYCFVIKMPSSYPYIIKLLDIYITYKSICLMNA